MNCDELKSSYLAWMSGSWVCRSERDMLAVVSPFETLDGDHIEVYVKVFEDGTVGVTDFGETLRFLAGQSLGIDTDLRQDFAGYIVTRYGVELKEHRLQKRVPLVEVSEAIWDVLTASRFMADLVFTARPREESNFNYEVGIHLKQWVEKLEIKPDLRGESGRLYKADFRAFSQRELWIEAITSGSRSSLNEQVNRTYAMWSDALPSLRRLTLVDNRSPVFDGEVVAFLEKVSQVLPFNEEENTIEAVRARVLSLTTAA